jgi:xanthine/CO dehydrogenase XdhC/CoxF family maturation factor
MGLGLGCRGIIEILLEPLTERDFFYMESIERILETKQNVALATIFRVQGNTRAKVGDRVLFSEDGVLQENTQDALLLQKLKKERVFQQAKSLVKIYELQDAQVEVLWELLQAMTMIIVGGAHDALPLTRFAKELGWQVVVVDHRPIYANPEFFPQADQIILSQPQDIAQHLFLTPQTVAVILTHNYLHDLELLSYFLRSPVRYVGILGSKNRTEKILQEISEQGIFFSQKQKKRLHSPIGLDIGADNGTEIALSILAEIQAVLNNRVGGFLKKRKKPIHSEK